MVKLIEKWIKQIDAIFFGLSQENRGRKIEMVDNIVKMIQHTKFNGIRFDQPIGLSRFNLLAMSIVDAHPIIMLCLESHRRGDPVNVPIFSLPVGDIETIHDTLKKFKVFGQT